jgi:hypothetical protein
MKTSMIQSAPWGLSVLIFAGNLPAGEAVYPLKVSENHRYFVDQKGDPVFWLGTTQWQLFREYKLEEARTIIGRTKAHGFAFAQVMLMGVGDGTKPNVPGDRPWIEDNTLTPNERYFAHVDAVVQIARDHNLVISISAAKPPFPSPWTSSPPAGCTPSGLNRERANRQRPVASATAASNRSRRPTDGRMHC